MTQKKELILQTALRLFSEHGFDTTPTSLIAKEAKVSEGLIFRHFENKDGLMQAILLLGEERIKPFIEKIIEETDPRTQIHEIIELTQNLFQHEKEFWKLQFLIKWQKKYKKTYHSSEMFERLIETGVTAFQKLGYENPVMEVKFLSTLLEGLTQQLMANQSDEAITEMVEYIKSKY